MQSQHSRLHAKARFYSFLDRSFGAFQLFGIDSSSARRTYGPRISCVRADPPGDSVSIDAARMSNCFAFMFSTISYKTHLWYCSLLTFSSQSTDFPLSNS